MLALKFCQNLTAEELLLNWIHDTGISVGGSICLIMIMTMLTIDSHRIWYLWINNSTKIRCVISWRQYLFIFHLYTRVLESVQFEKPVALMAYGICPWVREHGKKKRKKVKNSWIINVPISNSFSFFLFVFILSFSISWKTYNKTLGKTPLSSVFLPTSNQDQF